MPPLHVAKRPTPNGTFSCYRVLEGDLIALVFLLKHHCLTDMGLLISFPSRGVQTWSFISHVPLVLAHVIPICSQMLSSVMTQFC